MATQQAKNSGEQLQISQSTRSSALKLWLTDNLTILAEGFGAELTAPRLRVYVEDLCDLTQAQLQIALIRARRELRFFPQIAEIRQLAGVKPEDESKVAAEAAWNFVRKYLSKWGVDRMPQYAGGKEFRAPALPGRINYALRRIGGLRAMNAVEDAALPFMYRDFCEAFKLAPMAESLAPQLTESFGDRKLMSAVKELTSSGERSERPVS